MQPKSFTLDGKRYKIDSDVPMGSINWLMGKVHVGTPDSEIESDIAQRATKPGWNARKIKQAQRFALACHRANQDLYISTMRGV